MRRLASVGRNLLVAGSLTLGVTLPSACREAEPDLKRALQVTDIVTGWFDAGIVNGQNKLVPTISFRLKDVSDRSISNVDLNAVFRVVNDPQQLGSRYVRGIGGNGLAPSASTEPFVLRSELGYTSEAARTQMLQNSQFKDAQVELFARHGSQQWTKIHEQIIQRQLLTQ